MVRRWEVNRETPKFLGHGSCDSKSRLYFKVYFVIFPVHINRNFRSTTVVTPVHKADELSVIVLELFQQMTSEFAKRVIPLMRADSLLSVTLQDAALQVVEDLRGVGIQVSRLSQIGAHEPERSTQNVEKHSTIGIPQYINSSADASASSTVHKQHKVNHKLVIQKEHFFDREDESLSEEEDAISGDEVLNVNMSYTSPAASSRQNLRGGAVSFAREAPANDSSDNKNFDSDYVTSSQV